MRHGRRVRFCTGLLIVIGLMTTAPRTEEIAVTARNLLPPMVAQERQTDTTQGWKPWVFSGSDARLWVEATGRTGGPCFTIHSAEGADASWTVTAPVERNTWYTLSGWIKTEDVAGATGALLNIQNMQSVRTTAVTGTQDWTRVSAAFRAEAEALEINCLFGGWGESTGRAWYDGIMLAPLDIGMTAEADVRLSAASAGDAISPQLFGHNLEHTRRAIWTGLSAQMVANRKFAAVDSGLAMHWWTLSGSGVSVDDRKAYTGKHSLRVENPEGTDCGVWQQHDWLAFGEGERYVFRIWARAETEQSLWMRVVTRSGFTNICGAETVVKPGGWQLWTGEFTAACSAHGARLELRVPTPGPVWIGAVSLMPADNFHGMRRDVVDLLKEMKPGNLRWPGGCFAEYYDWREGLLPVDQRPPIGPHRWVGLLPDSDGYDSHEIGIDEYIALCRELNAAPAITTRFSEGSPEEAAAWVEYCNGAPGTEWGKVRAERGHPEPYGVKYWYVGNELTGMSLLQGEARTNPAILAGLCREHVEAMRGADPSITLNVGIPASAPWLESLFAEVGGQVDLVQTGFYFAPDFDMTMGDIVHTPAHNILPGLREMRGLLDRVAPEGKTLGITYYEWNVMWDRYGDTRSGVFAALMLNLFCREAESLGLVQASYFQPVTEGAIKVAPRTSAFEPDGQVFALFAQHQGNKLLDVPRDADGAIDLCASLTPDGGSVFVTAVNRNGAELSTLRLSLEGLGSLDSASAELLIPAAGCGGRFAERTETLEVGDGPQIALSLPPHSAAGIRLRVSR